MRTRIPRNIARVLMQLAGFEADVIVYNRRDSPALTPEVAERKEDFRIVREMADYEQFVKEKIILREMELYERQRRKAG